MKRPDGGPEAERLASLLRKNRRRLLAPAWVQAWLSRKVAVSLVSHERQERLVAELRQWRGGDYEVVSNITAVIEAFVGGADLVVVADWDAQEQPALLAPGAALCRSTEELRSLYPDGLVLWNGPAALVVDFDDEVGEVRVKRLHDGSNTLQS
ncbi:MAG: hypothetical protein EON91_08095 [Brevundimonas sp.]|uniref:hypothetical protein n=1 Tax=Brevundimonas sp. TaxID=1871086 RepID=UPI00120FE20C|nr:hypothetical protein [Brevundimonas sp.]RZJ17710.1 MAG: hypothetical protein EON91_08095 [Brevundimonas sp.]